MNKEQDMEISQLKFMLEEKSTEASDGSFFLLRNALFGLGERKGKEKKESGEFKSTFCNSFFVWRGI